MFYNCWVETEIKIEIIDPMPFIKLLFILETIAKTEALIRCAVHY